MEYRDCSLLRFLTACGTSYRILVVERCEYLPPLRQMFPLAELWCAVADRDMADEENVQGLKVRWVFTDYLSQRLPLEEEFFDYIVAEEGLSQAANPQDIASGLGLYLKPTGYLLLSFANIRYWRVLENLMEGHFYHVCTRAFTRDEMTKLMAASFYKDVQFLPMEGRRPPEGLVEKLEAGGFQNMDNDLLAEAWLVRAAKSTPEIMELKRMYTPELRQRLAVLLRRLEYGIRLDAEGRDNLSLLWQLCREHFIFPAYLASFVKETVVHTNSLLWQLFAWQKSAVAEQQEFWAELLEEMQDVYEERQDFQVVLDWWQGQPEPLPAGQVPDLLFWSEQESSGAGGKVFQGRKIAFITCVNKPEIYEEALLYMKQLRLPEGMEVEFISIEGARSMCGGYNQGMVGTDADYKVYVHQDTLIVNKNFVFDLLKLFSDKSIGIVGMIGARKLPASGVWWDAMRTYGKVLHACEPECVVETACMEPPVDWLEVEALDGLLLATAVDVPWREDLFDGWHFYDVSMCKEIQRLGYKAAVPRQDDFWCIHCPKEKPLDGTYKFYQRRFLREYGGELDPEI